MESKAAQRSEDWYRVRLGKITGSEVSKIFVQSKKKDRIFGDTAMTYLETKASERMIIDEVVKRDDALMEFLDNNGYLISNKYMDFGTEHEPMARKKYIYVKGYEAVECGAFINDELPFFSDSPDGVVHEDGVIVGTIEIKVPTLSTYIHYRNWIKDAETLKSVKPEYYWQCMSHIMNTGAEWCDFVAFNPYVKDNIHIVRIERNEDVLQQLRERLIIANETIEDIVNGGKFS